MRTRSDTDQAAGGPRPLRRLAAAGVVTSSLCFFTCFLACSQGAAGQDVDVPTPTFEAFYPKGLRVSIPDMPGLEIFAFHGSVNKPVAGVEAGDMSVDITTRTAGGRWAYYNQNRRLKVGDVINYWVWIQVDRRGYQRLGLSHRVTELVPLEGTLPGDVGMEPQIVAVQITEGRPTQSLEGLLQGLLGQGMQGQQVVQVQQVSQGSLGSPSDLSPEESELQEQYRPRPQRPSTSESSPYDPYDSRPYRPPGPPPGDYNRPPPGDNRPPPGDYNRPPPGDNRPPPGDYNRPPPGDHRPPPGDYNRPTVDHRPPPGDYNRPTVDHRPPPGDYNRPPVDHRPPTGEYRPPNNHYGSRPPPPTYNHEYPPPPPATGTVVHHNHHVGFATGGGDNQGQERPTNTNTNYNENVYPTNPNYPTVERPTHQGMEQPPTNPVSTDYEPTLAAVSPTTSGQSWWQGANQGANPAVGPAVVGVGLPLTPGDRVSERPSPARPGSCELSATHVNGRAACKGAVVFEEEWSTLDPRKWSHEVKISGSPDYEFCIYAQHPENTFVKKRMLHLKATLTNDKYGEDFVRKGKLQLDGCTAGALNSDSCSREAMFSYILPPVVASRLTTKQSFSFKYGKVEVRARLPRGDWIYPEVWLQPTAEEYGPGLASGRIHLAMARGNPKLLGPAPGRQDISGRELAVGVLAGGNGVGSADARKKFFTRRNDLGHWGAEFHNYTMLWTPDTLAFAVDGVELGVARPEEIGGLLHGQDTNGDDPWSRGSKIAPFDKEFYISLGLAVGGIHAFPDGCRSGNHEKPWRNTAAKAMLSFWNARDVWHPTWNGQQSELLVQSVRVTALNN